ncbi:MAG: S1C family serine protease, partial [Chloroflexi bacterium]|nr:S1C family serine protease [Chloroflexota bacterium]
MPRERASCGMLSLVLVVSLLAGACAGGGLGTVATLVVLQARPVSPAASAPGTWAWPTPGATGSVTLQEESATIDVVARISPAVVTVVNTLPAQRDWWGQVQQPEARGSGVIIEASGYVVTNNHVVEDAQDLSVILQ